MAAAVRRMALPPSPPPPVVRPRCGGTVVTFDTPSLGFSVLDLNGVPVVSEVTDRAARKGVEVGDRLVCVDGCALPKLPTWKVAALMESCARPVSIELTKGPEEGFALDDVSRPLAHVQVSKMLHAATRLQPPFCMHLARGLVESYEKGGDVDLDDALGPTIKAFCEVLFADAPVQALSKMPPPWALEATKAAKAVLEREESGDLFTMLALASAAALPQHLMEPAEGWSGNRRLDDIAEEEMGADGDCIFKRENARTAAAAARIQAHQKTKATRVAAKRAVADAQPHDPACIFRQETTRATNAAHVVQRALKRATSSDVPTKKPVPREAKQAVEVRDERAALPPTLDLNGKWYTVDAQSGRPNGDRYEFRRTAPNAYATYRNGRETARSDFSIVNEHGHLKGKSKHRLPGARGRTSAPSFKVRDNGDLHWDIQDSKWLSRRDCGVECLLETRRSSGGALRIAAGSVVAFRNYGEGYGAIVNAANVGGLGGGGVDAAVNSAGGPRMHADRRALPVLNARNERIRVGGCVATGPNTYDAIGTEFVLHAVGPDFRRCGVNEGEALLAYAYASALRVAQAKGIRRVAFPLLSAGIFRGPLSLNRVVEVACKAVALHAYQGDVYLCGFLPDEQSALERAMRTMLTEGLVRPLDCVQQRAARAEAEAEMSDALRRRAEQLARREVRRASFRQAGATMVRATRAAREEEAQEAREKQDQAQSRFDQRRAAEREAVQQKRAEEARRDQHKKAEKDRAAEALLQRKADERRALEARRAREREEAEMRRAAEVAKTTEAKARREREAREVKQRNEAERRELEERRAAEARAFEAQRAAEKRALEERRAAEVRAAEQHKAEEAREYARAVAERAVIEAAREAVSGFHKGEARFSHRGPSGWEGYSPQHNDVIARALKASPGSGTVQLPGIPFEVRWGAQAISAKLVHPPPEGIIQVNTRSQNTRVVRRDSAAAAAAPTQLQSEAPPPPPATTWEWEDSTAAPPAWRLFDVGANQQLDEARAANWTFVIIAGTYRVDFASMTQVNVRTGFGRRVRRGGAPAAPPPRPPHSPQPPQPAPMLMRVQIPHGVPAGGLITVRALDGRLVRVRVPPGVAPGATITVRI